jgi:hypothetical protein
MCARYGGLALSPARPPAYHGSGGLGGLWGGLWASPGEELKGGVKGEGLTPYAG